ncbi:DJ-1/PfpI family protein [bacterium]|nr:DJ-1/PfpI family protein [bacterium]
MNIVALAYPGFTLLDLIGPYTTLAELPRARAAIYWKQPGEILTDSGITIMAQRGFEEVPEQTAVLLVPGGGAGCRALLQDQEVLQWLARVGRSAEWVTSVCTGSLLLGAAGLLEGYRATSHWSAREDLCHFGAIPSQGRYVRDRNRLTGGGVTAGIDFGLALAAELAGEETARAIALGIEYAPAPPFEAGTPEQAGPETVARVLAKINSR